MGEDETFLNTRQPSASEELLRNKFDEETINQVQRIEDVAKLLITIELAIPGLFATAMKLISGANSTLDLNQAVYASFTFWFFALTLTLIALLPRRYKVDRAVIRRTPPNEYAEPLSIEAYFNKTAKYKYHCIVGSCICFCLGICAAIYSIL